MEGEVRKKKKIPRPKIGEWIFLDTLIHIYSYRSLWFKTSNLDRRRGEEGNDLHDWKVRRKLNQERLKKKIVHVSEIPHQSCTSQRSGMIA